MHCISCGTSLPTEAAHCPTCGVVTPYNISSSEASPYDYTVASSSSGVPQPKPATDYGSPPYGVPPQNPYDLLNPYQVPPPPPLPPSRRRVSFIVIIVLSVAVIGLSVFTGLNLFHMVNFNNVHVAASAPTHPGGTYLGDSCPVNGSDYYIVNVKTGLVMDDTGGSKNSGTGIIQYPYGNGVNQQWQFVAAGTSGNFKIVNAFSNLLLDEPGGSQASGIGIVQNSDNGGLSQQWQCIPIGSNYFKIVSVNSNLVLDVANTNLTEIESLLQDSYTGGLNQQWLFVS